MENEPTTDSWDGFISGNFLRAIDVQSENDAYVVVDVTLKEDPDKKIKIQLNLQRNELNSDFQLNKTNAKKLKELGIISPKALIGKKVYFRKALVRSPKTNQEVESLRIAKIE